MTPRTIFLSRLIGLYYIFVTLSMIMRKQSIVEWVTRVVHDPTEGFLAGVIGVAIGLAMILGHNVWSGGAVAVVVTLIGWATLIKSLLFLYLPPELEAELFLRRAHYQDFFYFYMALSLAIGIYLTYRGFLSARRT